MKSKTKAAGTAASKLIDEKIAELGDWRGKTLVRMRPLNIYNCRIGKITMAQSKPEDKTTLDQVLRLVNQLTLEEQEELVEEMKLQWLKRELAKAEVSLDKGEGIPGDNVFFELKDRLEHKKLGK